MQLPVDPIPSAAELKRLAKDLLKKNVNELSLKNVRLDLYSEEQIEALLELIRQAKITTLSFEDNELGSAISLERLKMLCEGLKNSSVKILNIDNNKLHCFSSEHWQVLEKLLTKLSLDLISLQHNNLVALEKESYLAFNTLIHRANCPCHIAFNNWCLNFSRWVKLTSLETNTNIATNRYSLLNVQVGQEEIDEENKSAYEP